MESRKTICFAYFADNKFIGWYSDTFGTITKNSPKLYGNSEEQLETISKNFRHKVQKAKGLIEDDLRSFAAKIIEPLNPEAGAIMKESKSPLAEYDYVELRVVECPIYDGPNPDFDKEAYKKLTDEREERWKKFEKDKNLSSGFSFKRMEAAEEFEKTDPRPYRNSWIYADYAKVKEWANNEPTEFLETITPNYEEANS
jgi:hypothetical protein